MKLLIDTQLKTVTIEGTADSKELIERIRKIGKEFADFKLIFGTIQQEVYIPTYPATPAYPTNPYPMTPWGGDVVFANPNPPIFTDANGKVWSVSGNNVANF